MRTIFLLTIAMTTGCHTATVYICGSNSGLRYHLNKDCRGLKNCNYKVVATTVESAKQDGRTLCKWEQ